MCGVVDFSKSLPENQLWRFLASVLANRLSLARRVLQQRSIKATIRPNRSRAFPHARGRIDTVVSCAVNLRHVAHVRDEKPETGMAVFFAVCTFLFLLRSRKRSALKQKAAMPDFRRYVAGKSLLGFG